MSITTILSSIAVSNNEELNALIGENIVEARRKDRTNYSQVVIANLSTESVSLTEVGNIDMDIADVFYDMIDRVRPEVLYRDADDRTVAVTAFSRIAHMPEHTAALPQFAYELAYTHLGSYLGVICVGILEKGVVVELDRTASVWTA